MTKETYTLVDKHDRKQKFDNGRDAGEAFARANGEDRPVVIKSTEGKGAQFLASTAQSHDRETGEKTHIKDFNRSDTAFREGWEKVEREKIAAAYERDRAAGVKTGMMRLDGKEVAEVRVYENRDDTAGKATYDVQYFKRQGSEHGTAFTQHRGLDRPALETAIGETNAKAVQESGQKAVSLSGDRLAYAQGVSPQEKERRELETKQPARTDKQEVSYSKDGGEKRAEIAEEGKSYQGKVIAVTAEYIIQRHIDAKTGKETDVAHDRKAVSNYKDSDQSIGKFHSISYSNGKAGLAKEISELDVQLDKQVRKEFTKEGSFAAHVAAAKNDVAESKFMGTSHLVSANKLADFKYSSNSSSAASQAKQSGMERER